MGHSPVFGAYFNAGRFVGNRATIEASAFSGSDPKFFFSKEGYAHGITSVLPTDVFCALSPLSSATGGAFFQAVSIGDNRPFQIDAIFGTNNPTNNSAAIRFSAGKQLGIFVQPLDDDETVWDVYNYSSQIFTVLGNGNMGWGINNPSFPLHLNRSATNGVIVGLTPPSLDSGDILIYQNLPRVTGEVFALDASGEVPGGGIITQINNIFAGDADAHAIQKLITQATGGNPKYTFSIDGITDWTIGIDNSDNDVFKISKSLNFSTNNFFNIDTSGFIGLGTTAPSTPLHITSSPSANSYQVFLEPQNFTNNNILIAGIMGTIGAGASIWAFDFEATSEVEIIGRIINNNNVANTAHSKFELSVQPNGGDAKYTARLTSAGVNWSWGLDNSTTNDDWVLSRSIDLGTNNAIIVNASLQTLIRHPYVSKTANYSLSASSDETVDCTSGTFALTLPTAVGITGKIFNLKNSGVGVITINTTSGQTIDGSASGAITLSSKANLTVQSNGINWIIL